MPVTFCKFSLTKNRAFLSFNLSLCQPEQTLTRWHKMHYPRSIAQIKFKIDLKLGDDQPYKIEQLEVPSGAKQSGCASSNCVDH